jgi:hypothetical protein
VCPDSLAKELSVTWWGGFSVVWRLKAAGWMGVEGNAPVATAPGIKGMIRTVGEPILPGTCDRETLEDRDRAFPAASHDIFLE